MEEGNDAETWGRCSRQGRRCKGPGVGGRDGEDPVWLQQSVPGEEARVDTWVFALGKLEAVRGLGHWGGVV